MSSNSRPTVSVMMAVRNASRYLGEAVGSVLGQTMTDLELVAVDDGSDDDSAAILRRFARRDPRVRVVCRGHRGIVATRNEILALARGRYLAVNDADDVSLPGRLAAQAAFLDRRPEVVCVGGAFDVIDSAGRRLATLHPPPDDAAIQEQLLAGHCAITHSCALIRGDAAARAGGYGPRFAYAHDLELWLRLGELGALANLGAVVARYRLHAASVTQVKRLEQRQLTRAACEEAWARRGVTRPFEGGEPPRPGPDRRSRHRFTVQCGWWAYGSGERRTALIYGAKAVAARPLHPAGWKLMACAAVKPRVVESRPRVTPDSRA